MKPPMNARPMFQIAQAAVTRLKKRSFLVFPKWHEPDKFQ